MQQGGTGLPPTTDVGRRIPVPAKEGARSEASEWERRERREREEEREAAPEDLGVEEPCISPHPPSWHPQKGVGRGDRFFLFFHLLFLWCDLYLQGKVREEGKGKLATCRHRADSGGETVKSAPP